MILVTPHLKKQSPLQALQTGFGRKVLHQSHWPETLDRPVGQGTLGGLPGEVHGQSLMSESTDRLSLSFCRERTFRLKGIFSQHFLCFDDRNDRRKVGFSIYPLKWIFSHFCAAPADETSCLDSGCLKGTFIPRAVVKLVFPWNSKGWDIPFCHLSDADLFYLFGLSYDV